MDSPLSSYLSKAIKDLIESNWQLSLVHDFSDGGWCDDTQKLLIVNIKKSISEWFPTFVHEYCHFKQWKDGRFIGKKWDDTFRRLYKWMDGKETLTKKERILFSNRARRVELDCEKRTVQEILKNNLPINKDKYIQQANAYIFSYSFLEEDQPQYYTSGAYDNPEVYALMPTHFLSRYDRLPKKYREIIHKLTEEEKE